MLVRLQAGEQLIWAGATGKPMRGGKCLAVLHHLLTAEQLCTQRRISGGVCANSDAQRGA